MELIDKAHILAEFYAVRYDDDWITFFDDHLDGVTLGYLIDSGDVLQLNSEGEAKLLDAYDALLQEWGVQDKEYSSLQELIIGPELEEE